MLKSMKSAVLVAAAVLAVGTQVQAAPVFMSLTDIHPPVAGVAGFNGTSITSPGGVDDFIVNVDGTAITIPNSAFQITSGFTLGATLVADANANNILDNGDTVVANITTGGAFDIVDTTIPGPAGVLVHGVFNSASVNTSVGSSAFTLNSANVNGLDLTPGPALIALGVNSLDEAESFTISLVGIGGLGVQVLPTPPVFLGLFSTQILPFATTYGSINLSATTVVPEPASVGLLSIGAVSLLARRRRA